MEREALGIQPLADELVEHSARADVVERVDDDLRVGLRGGVRGQPRGDGVAGAFVVGVVRPLVLVVQIVIEQDQVVLVLGQQLDGPAHVKRHVEPAPG